MPDLQQKLTKLDSILIAGNAPLARYFNAGLPKDEIVSFLTSHGIAPHPDLVTFYHWHNGIDTVYGRYEDEVHLVPFGSFFDMQQMLKMRTDFRRWAEDDFEDLNEFENIADLVPLLGSGEDDMYLLNTATGQMLAYQPAIQVFGELVFNSIESLVDVILECFENGAYKIDKGKGIIIEMEQYQTVCNRHLSR